MAERDWQKDWERCEKATLGPWVWEDWEEDDGPNRYTLTAPPETRPDYPGLYPWLRNCLITDEEHRISEADREFIAEAREALPYWLQRVRELEAENARLRAVVEPLELQDKEMLLSKIRELKQRDGESWLIGEVAERLLAVLEEVQDR